MALFAKEDKALKPDDGLQAATSSPASTSVAADPADVQAHLGKGTRIEGKLTFEGSVRVDGQIEGEINAEETVILGENAVLAAQITADTVLIQGRVNGDVTARKLVELRAPATVVGNITTPSLVIHEGVVFEGRCIMGGEGETRPDRGDKRVAIFPAETLDNESRQPSEAAG